MTDPRLLRILLAFYGPDEAESGRSFKSIAGIAGERKYLCGPPNETETARDDAWARYGALRLEDECLIMVRTTSAALQHVVQVLQRAGSPAIFVLSHPPAPDGADLAYAPAVADLGEDFARALAERRGAAHFAKRNLLEKLASSEQKVEASRSVLGQSVRLDHVLTGAAEWLLDNGHLIRTQAAEIRRHLPRHYDRILPADEAGRLYTYELAKALAAHHNYALDEASIADCLRRYQETAPLSIAELWSFPILLRVALIEALAALAVRISRAQSLREAAYLWANRLAAGARRNPEVFATILERMEAEPVAIEPYFLTSLAEQLREEEEALAPLQHWIEQRLGKPLTDIVRGQHTEEAAGSVSTANAFGSLRALSRIEFADLFESVSLVEAELRTDPGGVYSRSDFATRDRCRQAVERIARQSGNKELEVARRANAMAAAGLDTATGHVSYYLIGEGVFRMEAESQARLPLRMQLLRALRRRPTAVYLGSVLALTLCFVLVSLALAWHGGMRHEMHLVVLGILALIPMSELSIQIINVLVVSLLPPEELPAMEYKDGIPSAQATLVVVPMLLSSIELARREVEKLEVRFLANRQPNLYFSLFSDFTDAAQKEKPGDGEVLQVLRDAIASLNSRYPGGTFLLFHRPRVWSESEQKWIGRERKRGKLEELNEFLAGEGSPEILLEGSLPAPIRSVITLDSDTQLPPGSARRMIETIAHPLNRVEIDPATRVRRRGYTIIQPRVEIALPGAIATRFTRIFADTQGTDPYCQAVSDVSQDLFGEGIFQGKAIYDLHAFRTILSGRFPPETLLSHDLIEGCYTGVGMATGVQLFESLPLDYASHSRRQQRWIRGDWQIAPWVFGHVPTAPGAKEPNPLSPISRWRIFDNLRRSLVPIAFLLLLLLGWLFSRAPNVWTLVVLMAIAIPGVTPLLDRLARVLQGAVYGWRGAADELVRAGVMLAFLPHQAWLAVDAISRAAYRGAISRRHMLEWQTAEHVGASAHKFASAIRRQLWIISGLSILLIILLRLHHADVATCALAGLWVLSPGVFEWLGRSRAIEDGRSLTRQDTRYLRRQARKTWRYFDDLVGPDSHWLPPDNSQLSLNIEVARRTSPTNIGLWLASALAARDFGYLTGGEFHRRLSQTMATLDRLERYEGHLLNWYDTSTLAPLLPRYVSTVDSGNLIASLWILQQGCRETLRDPLLDQTCLRGLADTTAILRETCGHDSSVSAPLRVLRRLLRGKAEGHELIARLRLAANPIAQMHQSARWHDEAGDERTYWLGRLTAEIDSWIENIDRYLHWMETLAEPPDSMLAALGEKTAGLRRRILHSAPSLLSLASNAPAPIDGLFSARGTDGANGSLGQWLDQLQTEYRSAQAAAAETVQGFEELIHQAEQLAAGIKMGFLYDRRRRLFGIGYQVGAPLEFASHYDLLASECRVASLVAIAKGDVPITHWSSLARPYVHSAGHNALLSWSGTMFEYLMPLLFTRAFANSLLFWACRQAVKLQVEYGREKAMPWGVSECAYSALDARQTYQYRAFGVPALALEQDLEEDLVVAPYATMLALLVDPGAAIDNLRRLESAGLQGPMGFYESIDYTRQNTPGGEPGVVIYSYMAHHQGMSLLALLNVLHGRVTERRFHSDLRIRAVEALLFERIPITRSPLVEKQQTFPPIHDVPAEEAADRVWDDVSSVPRVHLQGNGSYSLMVTNSGAGYSRWKDFDITRWQSDTTLDGYGSFLYIRDLRSDHVWSAAQQPLGAPRGSASAHFSADRAEFHRNWGGIETILEVTVGGEDDVEIRRLTVTNRSVRSRSLEFTSYADLALAPHAADRAHPAFSKMFIETECPQPGVLLAHRRLRSPDEPPVWAAHALAGAESETQFETGRAVFLGRSNTPATAEALRRNLTGSAGAVLDPIFSLRCRAVLEPRARMEISFLTAAAGSREALLAVINKFRRNDSISRAFEMAWRRAQLEFRYLGIGPAAGHRFEDLAGHLLYPNAGLRLPGDRLARNRLGQSALWQYGISGDLPIVTVTLAEARGVPLIRELILAQNYWRLHGFRADLIILNQESYSYDRPLHQQLMRLIEARSPAELIDKPGGVFLRNWHALPSEHRELILAVSSAVFSGSRGPLQQQLLTSGEGVSIPPFTATGGQEEPSPPLPFLELPYFNGLGGFTPDGREYAVYLKPGSRTPAPWVNVIAHVTFGAIVSESGLGCTWFGNSQSNRLTPWYNDPTTGKLPEAIYLRDEESGAVWTPTALPIREQDAYRARHGHGYTVFEHNSHAIGQELTVFVPVSETAEGDPVKIMRLRLRNDSSRARRLTATFFAEWVLGTDREGQQMHVATSYDREAGAVLAVQSWSGNYSGRISFAASSPAASSYTGDRTQFLGRNGSPAMPAALGRARLDNRTGAGMDPAAALQVPVSLPRGGQVEVCFLLGQAESTDAVRALVKRFQTGAQIEAALNRTRQWWDSVLGTIQVRTPLLSTDFLLNQWLLYQSLSCRFWGRTALYQSSGAFGFRDQLQDSMALFYGTPGIARRHILAAAARQFTEGDVQHWWHAESGAGVRTRCSDDMLWLPYVVERYIEITGDQAILDEPAPFVEGPQLGPGENERLFVPAVSQHSEPLWVHCQRAIERATQFGPHGLPLIGAGDWNDGLNRVGIEGRGESVWLGWFFTVVLEAFAHAIEPRDPALADKWRAQARQVAHALEESAWDGEWYLRGFFDNGAPLGSHANEEARIDSLPQSWSVISRAADAGRARSAMESAERHLVDEGGRLIQLFAPPFDHSEPNPGYIMGYPQGLRENGGQYTHGSLWMAMAWARLGDGERAVHLLKLMNPIELNRIPDDVARYRGEPYVSAADVSSAPGMVGRAGWTWYTGSAAWMYRIWLEEVLGFRLRGDHLMVNPVLPDDWPGFEIVYRYRSARYEIAVSRHDAVEGAEIVLDGKRLEDGRIPLVDDAAIHRAEVRLPKMRIFRGQALAGAGLIQSR